ncbi:MAG: hypothetical protein L3J52_05920 [Proteobacteria bacterium]|nr:hypothetical protein [Pseudomonadota bacterium]
MIKYMLIVLLLAFVTTACQQQNNSDDETVKTKPATELKNCSKELKVCDNGRGVGRDPANNCEFHPCLSTSIKQSKDQTLCTQDVKQCPDGSFVGRDNKNNCNFPACPREDTSVLSNGRN